MLSLSVYPKQAGVVLSYRLVVPYGIMLRKALTAEITNKPANHEPTRHSQSICQHR